MRFFKITSTLIIVAMLALTTGCNKDCVKCTMGNNEHEFCKGDYASTNEWNAAIQVASNSGYDCP